MQKTHKSRRSSSSYSRRPSLDCDFSPFKLTFLPLSTCLSLTQPSFYPKSTQKTLDLGIILRPTLRKRPSSVTPLASRSWYVFFLYSLPSYCIENSVETFFTSKPLSFLANLPRASSNKLICFFFCVFPYLFRLLLSSFEEMWFYCRDSFSFRVLVEGGIRGYQSVSKSCQGVGFAFHCDDSLRTSWVICGSRILWMFQFWVEKHRDSSR